MATFMEINSGAILDENEIREMEANGEVVDWASLEEVVENVQGQPGYREDYDQWRPVNIPARS